MVTIVDLFLMLFTRLSGDQISIDGALCTLSKRRRECVPEASYTSSDLASSGGKQATILLRCRLLAIADQLQEGFPERRQIDDGVDDACVVSTWRVESDRDPADIQGLLLMSPSHSASSLSPITP